MVSLVCPACHAQVDIQNNVSECPQCGQALPLHSPATEAIELDSPPSAPPSFSARSSVPQAKNHLGTRVVSSRPTAVAASRAPDAFSEKTMSWSSASEP